MNKFLTTLLVLGVLSSAFAQNSTNASTCASPLAKADAPVNGTAPNPDGLLPLLSAPITVTGLKYCKKLEGQLSCCSADSINSLGDIFKGLLEKQQKQAGEQDKKCKEFMSTMTTAQGEATETKAKSSEIVTEAGGFARRFLQTPPPSGSTTTTQQQPPPSGSTTTTQQQPPPSGSTTTTQQQPPPSGSTTTTQQQPPPSGSTTTTQQQPPPSGSTTTTQQQPPPTNSTLNGTAPPKIGAACLASLLTIFPTGMDPKQFQELTKPPSDQLQKKMPGNGSNMSATVQNMQKTRAQCMKYMLGYHSKMACVACEPKQDQFFKDGKLKVHTNNCKELVENCFEFQLANEGASQMKHPDVAKSIHEMNDKVKTLMDAFNTQMKAFIGKCSKNETIDQATKDSMKANIQSILDLVKSSQQKPLPQKKRPTGCVDKNNCQSLCTNMLGKNGVNFNKTQDPGEDTQARILADSEVVITNDAVDISSTYSSGVESQATFATEPSSFISRQQFNFVAAVVTIFALFVAFI